MSNRQPPRGGNNWRNFIDDEDDFDDDVCAGDFAVGGGRSTAAAASGSGSGRNARATPTPRGRGRGSTATTQGAGYRAPLTTTTISSGRGRPSEPARQTVSEQVTVPMTQPHQVPSGRYVPRSVEEVPASSSIDDDSYNEDEDEEEIGNSTSDNNRHQHRTHQHTSATRGMGFSGGGGGGGMGGFQGSSSVGLTGASSSSLAAAYDHFVSSSSGHHRHRDHVQPECQILLATGGCEYGADCHYSHDVRSLQRHFPDAPLFNDPVVITAYHENRTSLTFSGDLAASSNTSSNGSSSHHRSRHTTAAPHLTNGGSTNNRHHSTTTSSAFSTRPAGGFQPPRTAAGANSAPSSSSSLSTTRGGGRGDIMRVGTDDTGVLRRGTGRPRGGGYLDSRVVEMSPGVFQIHRGSNDVDESDLDIFTRVIGGNLHRNRGGFGGGGAASSARTANPWMGTRTTSTPTTGRGGRGSRGGGQHRHHHFDPFAGGGVGGGNFEGGMDVDNMSYEELLQLQEDHGGDVPTPLPSNVLQTFPPVRYGTPAYHREVKAVLSSMRALNPTTTTSTAGTDKAADTRKKKTLTPTNAATGRPSFSGARPSTAIEIYDAEDGETGSDDDDVVALTPPESRVSATEETTSSAAPEIQDCLICCYPISQNPNDDEAPPASSSSAASSARAPLVRVLLCGHEFHSDCILEWFQQKRTCPICKQDLSALYHQMFNIGNNGRNPSAGRY